MDHRIIAPWRLLYFVYLFFCFLTLIPREKKTDFDTPVLQNQSHSLKVVCVCVCVCVCVFVCVRYSSSCLFLVSKPTATGRVVAMEF